MTEQTEINEELPLAESGETSKEAKEKVEVTEELAIGAGEEAQEEAIEEVEEVLPSELDSVQVQSILESILFASHHPVSMASLRGVFRKTNVDNDMLHRCVEQLMTSYAGGERGISLEEVAGGYQLRTKSDNSPWVRRLIKGRVFKLSGPSLEVLSIVAYKQPVVKSEIDQIRGVESGHLLRVLMEKNLVKFAGKSELPGKPMLYGTTREFLELFGLRNIRELPSLAEIDELIPEGILDAQDVEKETLGDLTIKLGLPTGQSYSESESELLTITEDLSKISATTEFFEQEKIRERERRDNERAQDIRERQIVGEPVSEEDQRWLARFEQKMQTIAVTNLPPAES